MQSVASRSLPYLPALDGLRALAVVAVLIYHGDTAWLPGGYLGVEVFFVLSGYLITTLLAAEWRQNGRVGLRGFWMRRARRLLPELAVVVAATAGYTLVTSPEVAARLRDDAVAVAAYVMNWRLIFIEEPYFQSFGRPSLLKHLWSLAVEEQFYLAWPLLFALIARLSGLRGVAIVALAGSVASAAWMAYLYQQGGDPSRLYYATDTRAAGLLLGCGLGIVCPPSQIAVRRAARWGYEAGFTLGLAGLAVLLVALDEASTFLYRGGFLLTGVLTGVLIATASRPGPRLPRFVFGSRAVRGIGLRSYGIYLWHWPVFMYTRPGEDIHASEPVVFALRVVLTFALAELSYRLVYHPVRTGALLAWARGFHARRAWTARLAGTTAALGVIMLAGGLATAEPARRPHYLSVPAFHGVVQAVELPPETPAQLPSEDPAATPTNEPAVEVPDDTAADPAVSPPEPASPPPAAPIVLPPVRPGPRPDVLAVGDSVMIGAAPYLGVVGRVEVDAEVGRQPAAIVRVLDQRQHAGALAPVVVVQMGNNGPITGGQVRSVVEAVDGVRQLVFVNVKTGKSWDEGNNATLAAFASGSVSVVDWYGASHDHPELFWDDGIHVRPEGAHVYARLIAAAVNPEPAPPARTPSPTPEPSPTVIPAPTQTATPGGTPVSSPTPGSTTTPAVPAATPGPGVSPTSSPPAAASPTTTPAPAETPHAPPAPPTQASSAVP